MTSHYCSVSKQTGLQTLLNLEAAFSRCWSAIPRLLKILRGHDGATRNLAFRPDGKKLVAADDTGILIWDVSSTQSSSSTVPLSEAIKSMILSPDGKMLALAQKGGLALWNIESKHQIGPAVGWYTDTRSIDNLAFSPDSAILAATDGRYTELWDVTGSPLRPLTAPIELNVGSITTLAFSPDGNKLAAGTDARRVVIWDISTLRGPQPPEDSGLTAPTIALSNQTFSGLSGTVKSLVFRPDGNWLALGSDEPSVSLLNIAAPASTPLTISQTQSVVNSVAFSPDGKTLASGSDDKTVVLWDVGADPSQQVGDRQIGTVLTGHQGKVNTVAFSSDGTTLASSSDDGAIMLWSMKYNARLAQQIPFPGANGVQSVAFSPNGTLLTAGRNTNSIALWDPISGYKPVPSITLLHRRSR